MMSIFIQTSHLLRRRPEYSTFGAKSAKASKYTRRRTRSCSKYQELEIDPRMSRRQLNVGVIASAIGIPYVGYWIVGGDDLKI